MSEMISPAGLLGTHSIILIVTWSTFVNAIIGGSPGVSLSFITVIRGINPSLSGGEWFPSKTVSFTRSLNK